MIVVFTPAAALIGSARTVTHPHSSVTGEPNICILTLPGGTEWELNQAACSTAFGKGRDPTPAECLFSARHG